MPRDSVGAPTVESAAAPADANAPAAASPAGRPAQQRAIRTRQQILLAAAQLFADNGIHGTALAEAAASAEVTKGALTFHFPTKDALVQALITEQEQRTLPRSARSCTPTPRRSSSWSRSPMRWAGCSPKT